MNSIEIKNPEPEPGQFIPDWLQNTISKQMDEIDEEIRHHEEAIKELNALYVAHANFLQKYSPFEQRNLSQKCSVDMITSPEALPQAEGRDGCGEEKAQDVGSATQHEQ